jgi:aquaporin Z
VGRRTLHIVAQFLGAIFAAWILFQIASGAAGFAIDNNSAGAFATNGFDAFSPGATAWPRRSCAKWS